MAITYPIEVADLKKCFGPTRALSGVSFTAERGTVLGLLGPNGAGKTTTVRILATLCRADSGTARIGGVDVGAEPQRVRRLIGLTGQYASVDDDLSGSENLQMIGELVNLPRRAARSRAGELLDWFGLTAAADRLARTYSGGMRRRLDLAASMVARPEVVFLDEPTTGLDPAARAAVWQAVAALAAAGTTVLLTSQYLAEVDALARSVVVVDDGRVVAAGTPTELKRRVGGQRLVVRTVHAADVDRTTALVAGVAGAATTTSVDGVVTSARCDAERAARVLTMLTEAGVPVAEAALSLPTLDEVFLALTGGSDTPRAQL
ncbi:MAG: ATP-binding cassette domain-containing protein [Jatrophihabitans sp.]